MGKKILLVEDNEVNQMLALDALQEEDYLVSLAINGKEALEILAKESFDVVLMDCQMPVMDGFEATREIRKTKNKIPIIAMTANAMTGDKEKCLDAGMDAYISKPFVLKDLLSILEKWISQDKKETEISKDPLTINKMEDFPELSGINTLEGLTIVRGDKVFYKKILEKFYQTNSNTLVDLKKALDAGQMKEAEMLVHTVRGSAVNIGAKELAEVSQRLETTIKSEQKEGSKLLLDNFSKSLNSILETLKVFSSQEKE